MKFRDFCQVISTCLGELLNSQVYTDIISLILYSQHWIKLAKSILIKKSCNDSRQVRFKPLLFTVRKKDSIILSNEYEYNHHSLFFCISISSVTIIAFKDPTHICNFILIVSHFNNFLTYCVYLILNLRVVTLSFISATRSHSTMLEK